MNLRSILFSAVVALALIETQVLGAPAPAPTPACKNVSVEGDATYCTVGPICSGKGDKPAGTNCPKAGDIAVKDCLKKLKSYTQAGTCVAPANIVCKKIKTGAWGCAVDTPTPAPTTKSPTPSATTTTPAPTTTKPPTPSATTTTPAPTTTKPTAPAGTPACTNVSVEGDATYCIAGPICSGKGDKPAGTSCPKAGDVAVKDCLKTIRSYTQAGKCVIPANTVCKKVKTGVWGCGYDAATLAKKFSAEDASDSTTGATAAATVGGVAAIAAVAAVVVYKRKKAQKQQPVESQDDVHVRVETPSFRP